MWTIATDDDFVVGLYPGTVIGPYERFLILDHNTESYDDLRPHERGGAYLEPDFVMNSANDARFLRLNLHNARFRLRLMDPRGREVDAGDGTAPLLRVVAWLLVMGVILETNGFIRWSESISTHVSGLSAPSNGADPRHGVHVITKRRTETTDRARLSSHVVGTPGQPNTGTQIFPPEDPNWRVRSVGASTP